MHVEGGQDAYTWLLEVQKKSLFALAALPKNFTAPLNSPVFFATI